MPRRSGISPAPRRLPGSPLVNSVSAIRGVSFEVPAGDIVTILGANGAGKTTVLKTVSGVMDPQKGSIRFEGREIGRMDPDKVMRLGISHVPEGREVFPFLTVRENLRMGAFIRRDPEGVRRLIAAINTAWLETLKDPPRIAAALPTADPMLQVGPETERLDAIIKGHVDTPGSRKNGLATVDPQRLQAQIDTVATAFDLKRKPPVDEEELQQRRAPDRQRQRDHGGGGIDRKAKPIGQRHQCEQHDGAEQRVRRQRQGDPVVRARQAVAHQRQRVEWQRYAGEIEQQD